MRDFLTALGLAMVIEGVAYALFPAGMQRMMAMVRQLPLPTLRSFGLLVAIFGLAGVWLARSAILTP